MQTWQAAGGAGLQHATHIHGLRIQGLAHRAGQLHQRIQHAAHLERVYGMGCRTVSLHRMRPAPGSLMEAPYPVSDADYLRCVAVVLLGWAWRKQTA